MRFNAHVQEKLNLLAMCILFFLLTLCSLHHHVDRPQLTPEEDFGKKLKCRVNYYYNSFSRE